MLRRHQWTNEGTKGQELVALLGLTNCRPVLANNSHTIFESNGVFFLSDRRDIYAQEIELRDFEEIKMVLHNHGVDALNLCTMNSKTPGPAYRSSRRKTRSPSHKPTLPNAKYSSNDMQIFLYA